MDYAELINGLKRFGSTERDICIQGIGVEPEKICEKVILAPWWEPSSLPGLGESTFLSNSERDAVKVWNLRLRKTDVTYIKTGIGAPVLMDVVLSLGVTKCKTILFVGSVGSLDENIGIGDVVIPEYSICGDGASRYIAGSDLQEAACFGEKVYPDPELFESIKKTVKEVCGKFNVNWHAGRNFSIDTITAQFAHIEEILNMGCNIIEMETAAAFRAAKMAGISIGAIFTVSDNTVMKKSLVSGRTKEEMERRRFVRCTLLPQILLSIFEAR